MKGPLVEVTGAVDLHCHPAPDLFPRLADDIEVAEHARGMGLRAVMIKCHYEPSPSRAAHAERIVPGIRVFGGIVLNHAVGGVNPAAAEAALQMGAREVWMPTVDARFHAEMHGGTGSYDVQRITVTHPFFKVPNLSVEELQDLTALGAYAEFGYCTISPMWGYANPARVADAVNAIGARHCLLVSDTGQRHNPMPAEALRVFAQSLFESGVSEEDVATMIRTNPMELLDLPAEIPEEALAT